MKKKLLFIYPHPSSFIQLDIKILSESFDVETNTYDWSNKQKTPINLLKQFFFLLFNTYKFPFLVVSFGGYWSFLPALFGKIFGKKTFIILHGTDCAAFHEINYGNLRKQPLRQFCKWSYTLAHRLLPVSESLIYTENTYYDKDKIIKQGYKHFFPKIKTPATVIPNGFELEKWMDQEENIEREKNSFITIVSGESQFKRKGIDFILESSKTLAHCKFYIVGMSDASEKYIAYQNVEFMGRIPQDMLREKYAQTKYYLQLSVFEGFGCALGEAMLCGCIPIGSNVNAIPEIIGHSGYILKQKNLEDLKSFLKEVIHSKTNLSKMAIEKISSDYRIEKRQNMLKETILES